ncbi:cytochrome P450 [Streptomyces sp. NPDC085944]|uniref:cytochrome P450 n=1 Tax=Streptomyces sp. NPDC085944 TaxID=3154962 RepID=UPI00341B015B
MHHEALIDGADPDPRCPTHHLPHDLGSSDDPYPVLEPLRAAGPVVRVRLYERFDVWWVTTHAAASAAMEASELSSDQRHVHPSLAQHVSPMRLGLIDKDGPEHARLRTATLGASSGGALPAFRRHAGALCAELVGALPPQRTTDLVPTLIEPLVDETIAGFLGLPQQVDAVLRAHADTLVRPMTGEAMRTEITEARRALRQHVRALPQLRPPCAGAAGSRGEALLDEWTDVLLQMYVAGRRSTADFLSTLVLGVLAQDRWAEGCRTPLARRRLCDEYLRLDGPIVRGVWRFARTDTVLAETPIRAGDIVIVSLALADRDPAAFSLPAVLDPGRTPNRHLQFGHGPHRCTGVPLVYGLADALLATLTQRYPDASTAGGDLARRSGRHSIFRGPARVMAALGPRQPV